jgi:indolepyruvate ferredoxin oxidoreductase
VLDMTGMSQKNGAVTSHVRIAAAPQDLLAARIATGEADLLLGCDLLTAAAPDAIAKTRPGRTKVIVNSHEQPTGAFARQPDWTFPTAKVFALLKDSVEDSVESLDATQLATALLGDAIGANLMMLGYAFQRGAVPLSLASITRAIELNGVAVSMNLQAFEWGRRAALDLRAVALAAAADKPVVVPLPRTLEAVIEHRKAFLLEYQDARYAQRYADFVHQVRDASRRAGVGGRVALEVAGGLFKLMAYKDEYEVARLYCDPQFERSLRDAFEGDFRLEFHMAPPLLSRRDADGRLVKRRFGAIMRLVFPVLARLKVLRGGPLDLFGRTAERRMERALVDEYRQAVETALARLTPATQDLVLRVAALPERVRGFGHVKERGVRQFRAEMADLLRQLESPAGEQALRA